MYQGGEGVPLDFGKARSYYERAAASESENDSVRYGAHYQLGWMDQYGHGMPIDLDKARKHYEKAASMKFKGKYSPCPAQSALRGLGGEGAGMTGAVGAPGTSDRSTNRKNKKSKTR